MKNIQHMVVSAVFIVFGFLKLNAQSSAPPVRAHHELIYDENNQCILMTGGSTPLDGGNSYKFFNDTWCFDGKNWKQTGLSGNERSGMKLAWHAKHKKIYSFGGFADNFSLSDLRILEKGEWKTINELPAMKSAEGGFVYDISRDKLIVFGGSPQMRMTNGETWEWDENGWKKFEGKSPEGRQAFAMVYDEKRKKTVLYGGMDGNGKLFDDGIWEYDGTKWENIKVSGAAPGARISPGYAYDSKKGMMILFGGVGNDNRQNDTWGWNGKEWKLLAADGPSPRAMGYMAYDKSRDKIVLFGGRLRWPNDANDTWEWDGKEWKEVK